MILITKTKLLFVALIVATTFMSACKKKEDKNPSPAKSEADKVSATQLEERLKVSLVGQLPDPKNAEKICGGGKMQAMASDPECGFVDIGALGTKIMNEYRAKKGLPPFIRAHEKELCAAREAKKAVEQKTPHASDGCGWKSQGATAGGRGGNKKGTVAKSVPWAPRLFFEEGPSGGHYQAMMTKRSRYVAFGYYTKDRNTHSIIVNYYDKLD